MCPGVVLGSEDSAEKKTEKSPVLVSSWSTHPF